MFSQTLKKLRKNSNLTQEQLAKIIGVERSSVGKYESTNTIPSMEILKSMAKTFNVSIDYLLGNETPAPKQKGVKIPVLGKVAAGIPIEAVEEILDYEEISPDVAKNGDYFALSIHGDSMEPRISEGDVVIVRRQDDAESGDIVIAYINGYDATCKKLKKRPEGLMLIPNNPAHEPMFYTNEQAESLPVRILGKVVELRGKFN